MPRDDDKNNASRGGRGRPFGAKGRSGKPRGPEKKFAKRGFEGKKFDGERGGDKPRFSRDDRPRGDRPFRDRPARDGDGEKRAFKPRGDRPKFDRHGDRGDDRRPYTPRTDRDGAGQAARFSDRKYGDKKPYSSRERDGDKRPYKPRGEGFRKDGDRPRGDRPYSARPPRDGDRPARKFGGERKFDHGADRNRDRGPRKDFKKDFGDRPPRGESKPWQKREDGFERPARREGERKFDRPKFDKPRYDRPRDDRGGDDRPRFSRPSDDREERPKFGRPRWDRGDDSGDRRPRDRKSDPGRPEGRRDWQEHPRSERGGDRKSDRGDRFADRGERFAERPRRDNEDDSKVFAKRPAFGGRGEYRERKRDFKERDFDRRAPREEPKPKKTGERIAKVLARAGIASRRDAEEMVVQGRVTVNGRVINSPALDVTVNDVVAVDGAVLPPRERTRLFLYHKPKGLMTTHADPEGRPTVFDHLPAGLPRLVSVGRLDFNTEGLLLLTNDGGLARALELPDTGWLRRYRVRAHGEITQAQLDELKSGIEVDGVKYGPIDATLERDQGSNVWLVFAIREGKNREVRNVMAHLGLEVNRLIRVSYGPFQLGELAEGQVDEVRTRVLREQLGEKVIAQAGADFATPEQRNAEEDDAPRGKKPFKASGKNALVSDRKGRRVLVQRSGSEAARARNEDEANGYGPPRRPKRGYHGKRDLRPQDE